MKLTPEQEKLSIASIIESGELTIENLGRIKIHVSHHPKFTSPNFFKATFTMARKLKQILKIKLNENQKRGEDY